MQMHMSFNNAKYNQIGCTIRRIKVIFGDIILYYIYMGVWVCWYVRGEFCAYIHRIHWIEKKYDFKIKK